MIRLTILGDVDLRSGDDTVIGSVLSQPRRFALLVYLALEGTRTGVQRDEVTGVFWPDCAEDKARQSLRTATHFLRRSLGRTAITTRGSDLVVDPDQLSCDAVEFRASLEQGDLERALSLYSGDLLPGFYPDGAPVELERWLEEQRSVLRRDAADAAWALAETQEQGGNQAGAGAWARRAAELSVDDEPAVRRAIALLGRVGDRAGALAAYEDLAARLEEQFDATPSSETRAAIARVRNEEPLVREPVESPPTDRDRVQPDVAGRDAAAAEESPGELVPSAGGLSEAPSPDRPRWSLGKRPRGPLGTVVSTAVTLVLVLSFYSLWGLNRPDPAWTMPTDAPRPVIQVEGIRDFSDAAGAGDLAGALTMELAARLSETEGLVVVPEGSSTSVPKGVPTPRYILRAGLLRSDSAARVMAMLVDAQSGATLERIVAERPLGETTSTVEDLAVTLGMEVRREVGRAVADYDRRADATNAHALDLVRAGLRDLEAADSLRKAGATEAATVGYAAADSQLALAQQASPRWPEPSVQRAKVALKEMWLHLIPHRDTDRLAAVIRDGLRHAKQAISIAPDDPAALEMAGELLYWQWMTGPAHDPATAEAGKLAETYLKRATRLNPGLERSWSRLSVLQESKGDFAAAHFSASKAYSADAYLEDAGNVALRLITTALEAGDTKAAQRWCVSLADRSKHTVQAAYCQLQLLAWRPELGGGDRASVLEIISSATTSGTWAAHLVPQFRLLGAVVLATHGHHEEARAVLASQGTDFDQDLTQLEYAAWAYLALGERAEASRLLTQAAFQHPLKAPRVLRSARFAELLADPHSSL